VSGALAVPADAAPRGIRAWATPRRLQLLVAVSLVPVAVSALALSLTSDHLEHPGATAAYKAGLAVAHLLVGLLWWTRRPTSRIGPLLVVLGYLAWLLSWQSAEQPLVYTVGVLVEAPAVLLNFAVLLTFPVGRLRTAVDRVLIWALGLALAAGYGASLLFAPSLEGRGILSRCTGPCPENVFDVGSRPQLVATLGDVLASTTLVVAAGITAVYLWRLREATHPQRRTLLAVAVTSLLLLPAFFAFQLASQLLDAGPNVADALAWAVAVTRIVSPIGFAVALFQADLFAGRALRRLLDDLAARPSPERWRDTVAQALDDPSLRIGYAEPVSGRYLEADGAELAPPDDGRLWVPVERRRQGVAALVVDPALAYDPELVDAAATATLVAVETGQLEGELRASRALVLEAGDAERRRIGRDLHDSAQQRLVALRVHLGVARDQLARPDEQSLVDELGRELDTALDELRNVARGIYPPVLTQYGVAAALRSVGRDAALPVEVRAARVGRYAEAIELAVYFCCLEAIQNAAKHAGPRARVVVELAGSARRLDFAVEDDGAGFDPAGVERGVGLTNLETRMGAVGGELEVVSSPGRGTRVAGYVPL
jgi:signal transduction histidine kinase